MAIDLTDRTSAARSHAAGSAAGRAALAALRAPSIFARRPWRWRLHDEVAELWSDPDDQLVEVDPDGMLMTLSCGIALHHACVALTALGQVPSVQRLPDATRSRLVATLRSGGPLHPTGEERRAYESLRLHPDGDSSNPYGDDLAAEVASLPDIAELGARLHVLGRDQLPDLALAAELAGRREIPDSRLREEQGVWSQHPPRTGAKPPPPGGGSDGSGDAAGPAAFDTDTDARYAILFAGTDDAAGWLAAGEATSSILILTAERGLDATPISHVVQAGDARERLRRLLPCPGHPMLVLRFARVPDRPAGVVDPVGPVPDPGTDSGQPERSNGRDGPRSA